MKIPNYDHALVPRAKIVEYLLSEAHIHGRPKAAFLSCFGFGPQRWEELAAALRTHVATHEVLKVEETPFGVRYTVEGEINTPDGRRPLMRSVWFIEAGEHLPRLVTAYPLKR